MVYSSKAPKHILIIRTDRMGDVLLSTPVLSAVKNTWPDVKTTMLIAPYTKDVVSGHPDLDEIIIDDANDKHNGLSGFLKLVKELKTKNFDIALILHPSFRLAALCFFAGIPLRVGTGYRMYSFMFNTRVLQHRKKSGRHELDLNLDLTRIIQAPFKDVKFKFHIPPEAQTRVESLLKQQGIIEKYVVLHPGSGGSALDWPLEKFAQLANELFNIHNIPVIITGSPAESQLADSIEKIAPNIIRMDGQLNIKELAFVLKKASVVVANSTGPLHLAVAVGSQVVGLYCTLTACHPNRWGPYNQLDAVITPPEDADYGKGENPMKLVTVEQVLNMVIKKAR